MTRVVNICVVSGQTIPNLIPIAQDKPQAVVLLVSEDMKQSAAHKGLLKALHKLGYNDKTAKNLTQIIDFPTGEPRQDEERGFEIFARIKSTHPHASMTLNLTGGNKLMALALLGAFEAAADLDETKADYKGDTAIYIDTAHELVHVIKPTSRPSIPMQGVLDIPLSFAAANLPRVRCNASNIDISDAIQKRKPITKYLAKHCDKLAFLIGTINMLYAANGSNLARQELNKEPWGETKNALGKLQEAGLLDWDGKCEITPMSENARRYLTGGWLEEYAFWVAVDQKTQHAMLEVTFDDNQKGRDTPNEFDVVVVHNNRMLVIECKTGRFGSNQQKDADIIYKLDSLKNQVGGIFAQGLLMSARELNHTTSKGDTVNTKERAQRHGLLTLEEKQIIKLPELVRAWCEQGQLT
jgi:hypothetical protein